MRCRHLLHSVLLCALGTAPAFADERDERDERDAHRSWRGTYTKSSYDGISNDLLTAGLGKTGLQNPVAPAFADSLHPTPAELRTLGVHNNYRALTDMSSNGGYGVLYGPNVDLTGNPTLGEGRIAGDEYIAYADPGSGRRNVTMMVQVPTSFDPSNPCIVAAPSSGSRGVYGAIATTGEWGLKRGCAVAYTDKGTGNGVHDLQNDTVNLIDGTRTDADAAGTASNFTARVSQAERLAFNSVTPNRFAVKHAHSQLNPEKNWGRDVLESIRFAFFVLNREHGSVHHRRAIRPENTIVIASSVSNGGGASLAAAEQDEDDEDEGLIDAVVVSEPQVQLRRLHGLAIQRGATPVTGIGKGLYDYITLANLYQPCAALAPENAAAPAGFFVVPSFAANRCAALRTKDLLSGDTTAEQAIAAQAILNANGWEPESNILGPSHYGFQVAPAVALTYANAHGRFSVLDNVCGLSFGATTAAGVPTALAPNALAQMFSVGNGVPPTSGINLINNNSRGGPLNEPLSFSPVSGLQDYNAEGAGCLRALLTGQGRDARRVRDGVAAVRRSGNLNGKPAIIVHGRADNLVPVNHSSRPYYGVNKLLEGRRSRLHYYEVTHAQHFEAFINPFLVPGVALLAGYDTRYIPLHVYGIEALNRMYDHLKHGTPLPPSQVVRTLPRGGVPGAAPPITAVNVPPIADSPAAANRILLEGKTLRVPD
jgi:hydroxybutyrate-dimer hydrolase